MKKYCTFVKYNTHIIVKALYRSENIFTTFGTPLYQQNSRLSRLPISAFWSLSAATSIKCPMKMYCGICPQAKGVVYSGTEG